MKAEIEAMQEQLDNLRKKYEDSLKPVFEVGKWYKSLDNKKLWHIVSVDGDCQRSYGFYCSDIWEDEYARGSSANEFRLATPQEVQEALTKEAIKKGFKEGEIVSAILGEGKIKTRWCLGKLTYRNIGGIMCLADSNYMIFHKGQWATIVEEPKTIEEHAEKFYKMWENSNNDNKQDFINYFKLNNYTIE